MEKACGTHLPIAVLLAAHAIAADPSRISAARCRKTFVPLSASQYIGQAGWQDQADGSIVGSTEYRTHGRSVMTCVVNLPTPATSAVLDFRGARVSFTGAKSGGGLEVAAHRKNGAPVCTVSGMRTSREDWIELGAAQYGLDFDRAIDRVTIAFTLSDVSDAGAVRADINAVSVRNRRDGETTIRCPPAIR